MESKSTSKSKSSTPSTVFENYKDSLKIRPDLSLKSYCRDNNIDYEKILDWMNRRGLSVRQLRAEARREGLGHQDHQPTFMQFRPQAGPGIADCRLKGVSISYPNNMNLTLQECTVESVISLLLAYQPQK